jgi:hypothetical protein
MIPAAASHSPRWRRLFSRTLGWLALAAAAPLLYACNARSLEAPTLVPSSTEQTTVATVLTRDVDLLFLIDDSA